MIKDNEYHRKYLQEYRKKNKYIYLTIPKDEYKEIEKLANKNGIKISTFIKENAMESIKKMNDNKVNIDELISKLREHNEKVKIIADNINKITHKSNITKTLSMDDEDFILMQLKSLEDLVKEYISN